MIDWLQGSLPFIHRPLCAGKVLKVSPAGELEWESECWTDAVGSHDQNFRLRSRHSSEIQFSFNPSKWLQGHNLFGCDDLPALLLESLSNVFMRVGIEHCPTELAASVRVATLTRVDITRSFSLPNREAVRSFIKAAEQSAYLRHRGRGQLTKESTLYFGHGSRRWSLKLYCKADEIEAHRLHAQLPHREDLLAWAENKLRVELTLRSLQLSELRLRAPLLWSDNSASKAFHTHLEGLDMAAQSKLPDAKLFELPKKLRTIYLLWLDGHDVRTVLSTRTFYRYRNLLLSQGVDIAMTRPRDPARDRPDLRRVLTAVPAEVPDWAKGTSLYFEPSKRAA